MSEFSYTNSTAGTTFNQMTNNFVDTDIDYLYRNVEQLKKQVGQANILYDLKAIGITPGTETAKTIALNMPANSILIYHKSGVAVPFYPERTGLLIVTKGLDESRVDFKFSIFRNLYIGFYDSLRGIENELWSGWNKVSTALVYSEETRKLNQNTSSIGDTYFDTTLNKPLWFNGNDWVDALGNKI